MQFQQSGQAIYLQIADYICEKILLEEWKAEDKIPSVRELAVQLEVNPNTVMRTYEFLKQQEMIYDKRGIGYFITAQGLQQAMTYRREEFTQKEMPAVFRIMYILGITPKDLAQPYEAFISTYNTKKTAHESK